MTGGVNVCVVTLFGLVLDVSNVDGNTALALFRSGVDHTEVALLVQVGVLVSQNLGDCSGQGGLTVVNVTDGTDVYVRLGALELSLSQEYSSYREDLRTCTRVSHRRTPP